MSKKEQLDQYLLQKGILDAATMDAEIKKMAEQCPAATATEKGLTTDIDKAFETYLIMSGNASTPASPTQAMAAMSQPTNAATAAERAAVGKQVLDTFQDKIAVGVNSRINLYLLGRPAPATYIPEGTQGVINAESWKTSIQEKIDKGIYRVLDDTTEDGKVIKSKSNYEALKQAMENGTPVAVHIGQLGTRPVGYILALGTATGTGSEAQVVSRQEAQQILTWKTNGYLGEAQGAALRLKTVTSRADKNNPGKSQTMKTVMVDVNKKMKIESGGYETIRIPSETKKTMTLKSELSFKVEDTSKTTGAQKHPTRVIRASVSVEVPTLVLVDKYQEKFQKTKADLSVPPTSAEDMVHMSEIIASARLEATSSENARQVLLLNPQFKDEVAQMQAAMQTQAPAGAAI